MSQANRYLEEQFPKYYVEPQKPAQLPEPVTIPIGARDDKEHNDSTGTGTASKQPFWKNRRNWLIAMIALAVIIVGVAVGSGVGTSLASKKNSDASAALATSIDQDNTQSAITSTSISAPTSTSDTETESTTISKTSNEETRSVT
jgi:negative regulator of sigma E activity